MPRQSSPIRPAGGTIPRAIRKGHPYAADGRQCFRRCRTRGSQMSWVKQEQDSLVETFRTTDPDAPTLCEGWNVGRLLAHLTQREHSLVARIVDSVARKPPGQEPGLNKLT